jgi:Ni/Co efflux regulator RcnB
MKPLALLAFAAAAMLTPLAAAPALADDRHGHYERGHHDYDTWDDRRDERRAYRHGYRNGHYDRHAHNGYYYRERWHWGAPPSSYYGRPDFRGGYRAWRRGDYVPHHYRTYPVSHRHVHGLYAPPRGYHWVRDDRGDYLLVGLTTGIILGAILD